MKTIKIKCPRPFGVVIAPDATKYLGYALSGAQKVLIVADEHVYKLYGNSLRKAIKSSDVEVYTFIYPSGENGKTKHVLDKLIILMTELGIKNTDYVIAFGGRSSASITGLASQVFNGGVPYVFVPTTLLGMINPVADGKVGVDFLGQKNLLSGVNYPAGCFVDTKYLTTLPAEHIRGGYAEIIRRAMVGDGKLITAMQEGTVKTEQMIYSAIKIYEKTKIPFLGYDKKYEFGLNFSKVAEKECVSGTSFEKLVAFGIVTAIDTAMALGVSYGLEEHMLNLFMKYGIKWDVGLPVNKMWQKISAQGGDKVTLALPKKPGKIKVVKLSKDKIQETF